MHQDERATAPGQRQGIVGCESLRFLGELPSLGTICFRRRAEVLRRALAPAPGGKCLRQSKFGRPRLGLVELFQRSLAIAGRDMQRGRQGAPSKPQRLVVDLRFGGAHALQGLRRQFAELRPIMGGEAAELAEPVRQRGVGDALIAGGEQ
jgi:hypothetical protein